MVDLSSGDFVYNIPLLDVDGYPINISYHSGITMDQEASWVGLGWNINPGVVNRNMRGIPDDFNGDQVTKEFNLKPNQTWGANYGTSFQLFGGELLPVTLGASLGLYYNNYKGVGFEFSVKPGISAGDKSKGQLTAGLGFSVNSQSGVGLTPSLGFSKLAASKDKSDNDLVSQSASVGAAFNSRTGLKAMTFGMSADKGTTSKNGKWQSSRPNGGANGGSSLSFANPTYVPSIQMPMSNLNISFNATLGGEIFGGHPAGSIGGYYSEQRLKERVQTVPAYGYFFSEQLQNSPFGMLDFNREKDGAFTENTPDLPLTNFSYDIYSVSGQGIGGMYKPFRSDVGTVYDSYTSSESNGGSLGGEIGGGNAVHGGIDFNLNTSTSSAGIWDQDNNVLQDFSFKGYNNYNKFYEPFYFKNVGEKTADPDDNYFTSLGGFDPERVALNQSGSDISTTRSMVKTTKDDDASISTAGIGRKKRQRRNQNISYLSASEASNTGVGLTSTINSYSQSDNNPLTTHISAIPRVDAGKGRNGHHVSEIRTTREDGAIYVYSIAAYNYNQDEITFDIAGNTPDLTAGLVSYTPGQDDSKDNKRGLDHYYSKTSLPGYAHSYLLSAILSPDYVDLTGDGPSPDDYGTYTKFNYSMCYGHNTDISPYGFDNPFQWRVPIESNKASYNQGLNTDANDDKANILYGKKEIWYIHSIETKNYVAEFSLSNREDGLGVLSSAGGINTANPLKKLDKITLYSRFDLLNNTTNAIPIKVVNFEYDYSVCPNVPNNSTAGDGKLTLTKIYFTYGNSSKGRLNSYKFGYCIDPATNAIDPTLNPSYNLKGYDRWGNYKPNPSSGVYAYDYPYVDQSGNADQYAKAWELNQITLPSGGQINVNYESDTYSYVQDKNAMEMVKVTGISNSKDPSTGNMLINSDADGNGSNYYLHLQLPVPITASSQSDADNQFASKYLGDILGKYLYYRFKVRLSNVESPDQYEYIAGYTKVEDNTAISDRYGADGYVSGTGYTTAYIRLKPQNIGDRSNSEDVNPIARSAWQFTRLNVPRIAYGEADANDDGIVQVVKSLSSIATSMLQLFEGFNRQLRGKDYGKKVDLSSSYVRLYSSNGIKYGGGCRVKKITINDEWGSMGTGNSSAAYSQVYDYNNLDGTSSGVATYEPLVGGDENPFRQPIFVKEENLMALDNDHYIETPFGESFFPSPSVVYGRVKVTSTSTNPTTQADATTLTGYTVHEFYTAKDFPTITNTTGIRKIPKQPKKLLSILKLDNQDYMTASQGYVVELNDMAGKPKANWVYQEGNADPISGVEYTYSTDATYPNRLNNSVQVIDNTGAVTTKQIGVDMDFVADARAAETHTESVGLQGNLDAFLAFIFPLAIPMILPAYSKEDTKFHSIVTTKIINRYGLLTTTTAYQDGARVKTENLAYDQETGEVLLTKTYNEFEKPVYNYTYPAHWAYDKMGPAYKNIGLLFKGVGIPSNGIVPIPNAGQYFVDGDEVLVTPNTTTSSTQYKYWVHNVTDGTITLLNKDGYADYGTVVGNYPADIKIIRSGRRNQQTAAIGTVSTLDYPYQSSYTTPSFTNVLNSGVTEYNDHWQTYEGLQSPVAPVCSGTYVLTNEGIALKTLLSEMSFHFTTGYTTLIWDNQGNGWADYRNTALVKYLPGPQQYWETDDVSNSGSNPYVNAEIFSTGGAKSACKISLVQKPLAGQSPMNWNTSELDATTFTPVCNSLCLSGDGYTYKFTVVQRQGSNSVNVEGTTTCYPIAKCAKCSPPSEYLCGFQINDILNPYYRGVRGDWRTDRTLTYLDERKHDNTNKVANGGTFNTFTPYWSFPSSSSGFLSASAGTKWVWKDQISKTNPHGNQVEQKDALGRYSSQLFGYNNTLVKAVASNSRYTQMAFDNVEDYVSDYSCDKAGHFDFQDAKAAGHAAQCSTASHSGKYSLQIAQNDSASVNRRIFSSGCTDNTTANSTDASVYRLHAEDCLGRFSPEDGYCSGSTYTRQNVSYVLSAWVKEDYTGTPPTTYSNAFISVKTDASGAPFNRIVPKIYGSGSIIDGWQRIYAVFTVPANAADMTVTLCSGSATHAYFDDIRLHPFNSNMKSYVYDPVTLRLTAVLDENNYATFYEYDEEGALTRVKKETIKGIYTIQEIRASKFKKSR
jgi:hypothetical protein